MEDKRHALRAVFFDYALQRQREATIARQRFAYYTRADTAVKILKSDQLWMRSVAVMNDAWEVRYGMACLNSALRDFGISRLKAIFDPIHPDLIDNVLIKLQRSEAALFNATYISCFSEHLSREDDIGRLSMWRAYGGSTGVALVFHGDALLSHSNALPIYSSPVVYAGQNDFNELFTQLCNRLESSRDLISEHLPGHVLADLWDCLRFAVLSTKHPAFEEEREWRVIYAPWEERSDRIKLDIESPGGIPQIVYKLPLKNFPEEGFVGAETHDGLDRIIIGPSNHPREMSHAIIQALADKKIAMPAHKVHISNVPLRVPNV